MTLPAGKGPVMTDRYPTFQVISQSVIHHIGGARKVLRLNDAVSYRRHGTFRVIAAKRNAGMLAVRLPNGMGTSLLIPACERVTIKDGVQYRECHIKFGFVCEKWALGHWSPRECTVEHATDGSYVIIDHSLNGAEIYVGKSLNECREWLEPQLH